MTFHNKSPYFPKLNAINPSYALKKNSSRKPESFITPPNYPGGNKALGEYIKSNLRYPEEAMKNMIQGTVAVDYDIDVFGRVTAAKVKHGLGYGCDEEAIRLVKGLIFEKRTYKGLRVVFHRQINIHFKIHEVIKTPLAEQTINYTIKSEDSSKPKENIINITVKIDNPPK